MKQEIIQHLSLDPKLGSIIATTKVDWPDVGDDIYYNLIRAIVFQQLSGKAASTIHGRFIGLFPEAYPYPEPLLALDLPDLRAVGLSRQKATYIQNVAEFFQQENLIGKDLADMDDEAVIQYLTQIKGVGRWTVEMLLMFTLNRPDVLPLDDLGIQQAIQLLYGFEEKGRGLKQRMMEIAEPWRPYRTYASMFLWRWKDGN
ncbi:DNA-3-methyladenine glycosylase family protein [Flavilitoribacter nigricans]|uniref:DNA-3-methyladenine glycosylase II n=1 Tax=Flavilitoribacter nigricans (strain ATCC 23147 / DSM 23189 / NBRC 102662 / NCIMB 1420 / SS-2) TaxID=1122177 RepID=A0A2D0NAV1_FLAN2|nr:DNA-3-methyladenine glycosylase [Flavilitoribacter nigricans]PHN05642.1 Fe-S cluster assembly protein HesB [Flavilitoribacter nigricans DSM 23189 = NBRC 102662]